MLDGKADNAEGPTGPGEVTLVEVRPSGSPNSAGTSLPITPMGCSTRTPGFSLAGA
jgi:hypothetical protein